MEKKQSLYAVANRVNKNHEDEINKLYVAVKEKASTYDALAQMIDLLLHLKIRNWQQLLKQS